MVQSVTPNSVGTDGNLRVHFVPAGVSNDPTSAADVQAGIDITYYLKTFTFGASESTIEDPRLTLTTTLSKPGLTTYTFELQYVFGDATDDAARVAFPKGAKGDFVIRWAHANADAFAAAQKVDIVPVEAGEPRKDTPTANSQFTITQTFGVVGIPRKDFSLLA
jgi:hypothetical protein